VPESYPAERDEEETPRQVTERQQNSDDSTDGKLAEDMNKKLTVNSESPNIPGKVENGANKSNSDDQKAKKKGISFNDEPTPSTSSDGGNRTAAKGEANSSKASNSPDHSPERHAPAKNTNNSANDSQQNNQSSDTQLGQPSTSASSRDNESAGNNGSAQTDRKINDSKGDDQQAEQKVLIEINGKFELVSAKDLEAMGLSHLMMENSDNGSVSGENTVT